MFKLVLCTVLSVLFSWAIGDEYCMTTAVTANLFLYIDRGFYGGNRYAMRRIAVQIVQGFILAMIILPCKYIFSLSIPDPILIMLASAAALMIGLPINYKHQYSPLNCTLANATFILAAYMVRDFSKYPYRVLHCIVGFLIGYLVNYILMPDQDRYEKVWGLIRECACELSENGASEVYSKARNELERNIKFLSEDSKKGLKRHRCSENEIIKIRCCHDLIAAAEKYLVCREQYKSGVSDAFLNETDEYVEIHRALRWVSDGARTEPGLRPDGRPRMPSPKTDAEILLCGCAIECEYAMKGLAGAEVPAME